MDNKKDYIIRVYLNTVEHNIIEIGWEYSWLPTDLESKLLDRNDFIRIEDCLIAKNDISYIEFIKNPNKQEEVAEPKVMEAKVND